MHPMTHPSRTAPATARPDEPVREGGTRAALDWFAAQARERFGARLRDIRLFGSWARGEATADSDVDVLVLVDDLTGPEAHALGHLGGDVLSRHGVLLVPLAMSSARMQELRDRERALPREIDRDGIPL